MFLATFLYSMHLKLFLSLELGTEKNETFSHVEVLVGVAELLPADTQILVFWFSSLSRCCFCFFPFLSVNFFLYIYA